MTQHTNHNSLTNNDQPDNNDDCGIGPTGRLHDTEGHREIRLIDLAVCTADVIYWHLDSDGPGGFTFSYDGGLHTEDDLRAAVYQVYIAMYRARNEIGAQLSPSKAGPRLFRTIVMDSPVVAEYKLPQVLSKAAARGIQDADIGLSGRSKDEICYRLLISESHLDISDAESV